MSGNQKCKKGQFCCWGHFCIVWIIQFKNLFLLSLLPLTRDVVSSKKLQICKKLKHLKWSVIYTIVISLATRKNKIAATALFETKT